MTEKNKIKRSKNENNLDDLPRGLKMDTTTGPYDFPNDVNNSSNTENNFPNIKKKVKKPGILKKVYNNLFNNNKNKKYGQSDLLKGKEYYPPKP